MFDFKLKDEEIENDYFINENTEADLFVYWELEKTFNK